MAMNKMKQEHIRAGKGEVLFFIVLLAAYFLTYFFRVSASVVMPMIASQWGLTATITGLLSSMYFYTYALMQPISGVLNDSFGPSRVVSAGLLVAGSGALLMAFARGAFIMGLGRLLTGLGLAPMLSGALVFQGAAFNPERYSTYSGLILFIGNLGAVSSVVPLQKALDAWGRESVFTGIFLITLLIAALLIIGRGFDKVAIRSTGRKTSLLVAIKGLGPAFKVVFSSRPLIAITFIWCGSMSALMSLQGLWAVTWSRQIYGSGEGVAGLWATLIGVGVMAGSLAGASVLMNRKRRRMAVVQLQVLLLASWAVLLAGMHYVLPFWFTAGVCFLIGAIVGFLHTHLTAAVNELAPVGQGGSVFGAANMLIFGSVIIMQSLTGVIITRISGGSGYSSEAFLGAFGMVGLVLLLGMLAVPALLSEDR